MQCRLDSYVGLAFLLFQNCAGGVSFPSSGFRVQGSTDSLNYAIDFRKMNRFGELCSLQL